MPTIKREDHYILGILEAALQLHGDINGTNSGYGGPYNTEKLVGWLKYRRDNWTPTVKDKYKRFDDTVLECVKAALAEYVDYINEDEVK